MFSVPPFALFGVPATCFALLPETLGGEIGLGWIVGCFALLTGVWIYGQFNWKPRSLDAKRAEQLRMDPEKILAQMGEARDR